MLDRGCCFGVVRLGMDLVIIEVAINGATSKWCNLNVPCSDDEIVVDVLICFGVGALIVYYYFDGVGYLGFEVVAVYAVIWCCILVEWFDALLYFMFNFYADGGYDYVYLEFLVVIGLVCFGLCDFGLVNLGWWCDGVFGGSFVYVNDFDMVVD